MNVERQVEEQGKFVVQIDPETQATLREELNSLTEWVNMDNIAPTIKMFLRKMVRPAFPEAESIYAED